MMAGGSGPIPRSGRLIKPPSTGRLIAILAATEDRFLRVELTLLYDWVISLRYNTLAWGFGRNGTKGKCIVMRLTFSSGWVTKAGRWQIADIQRGRTSQKQILEPLFRFR